MNYIKNLILYIGINILLYLGIMLVNKNTISLSELILFDALIVYFIEPLKDICDLSPVLKNGINALKRVSEIYAHKSDESNSDSLDNYDIDFRNLTFSYDNYTNILNNFNLKIKDGDKILITGTSGSGKSTIFKLLNKDYKTNNMIYIGQKEINSIDVSNYITYVSQDEKLFNDTLYNNIVLNNNDENLNKILQLTGLDKVLKYRNLNLNSIIEENGSNLSIGERERIIVSRALLKNSKILILDESLSGLENTDEFNIIKNILNAYIDKTIIYISHSKECNSLFEKKLTIDN
jgi:ABC-type bacteriocin/lantibiotic exporter with double-glycine peptidase domain